MSCHVLVVEDEPCISELLAMILEDAGYFVVVVSDGEAALMALNDAPYDLVVSDIMLPRLNGLDLIEAMRANLALAAIPVVLMSAVQPNRLMSVPHAAFVKKPFDLDSMVATVGMALTTAAPSQAIPA